MSNTRYWIATISKEHAQRGVAGNFIQVCHGKQAPLKRMRKGDFLLVYSSKVRMDGDEKCQAFTAIGQVADEEVYPFQMTEAFRPYRRNIEFLPCGEASILPLIPNLAFIADKQRWGYPFRFGFFEIGETDFELIRAKMSMNETIGQPI